ncbi:MAG: hypothetical protein AAFQ54_16220 [Pseudomonadota bacterium]
MCADKSAEVPLARNQGWIMPAGATGLCLYDTLLDMVSLTIGSDLLREAGLSDPATIAPVIGKVDPVLLQMVLGADSFSERGALYRETMQRALAAHLAQIAGAASAKLPDIADDRLRRVVAHIYDNLAGEADLQWLEGVTQFDFYHVEDHVNRAADQMAAHFRG